jgi:hypothetical protein
VSEPPEPTWVHYATAIGAILTPIAVAVLGATFAAISWRFRTRLERAHSLEDQLRSERVEIYNDILEPFIILLTTEVAWQSNPKHRKRPKDEVAGEILLSVEYRKRAFQLSLIGSDEVVRAYNELFQFFYGHTGTDVSSSVTKGMMTRLGNLLLAIRKSAGNEATKLESLDMVEWIFSDARRLRAEQ